MARVAGYGGQVDVGGNVLGIREWSIDYVAAALDSSDYTGGQDKTFTVGQREWSGSFNGLKNQAPLVVGSLHAAAAFEEVDGDATRKWVGPIIITACRAASVVDGLVTYAYDFQGNGAIATFPTA